MNEIVVLYADATDIAERAEVERSKYDSLTEQKKTFSYMPLAKGVIARRNLSCFRPGCFRALGRGLGTMDSNLTVCCECSGAELHAWYEQDINRTDALGIAERRAVAQREGKRQVGKLKPGMWVAAQDRSTSESDVYWIGQAVAIPGRDDSCIHKGPIEDRSEWIASTEFTRGDYAVGVRWWVKSATDPEERTFEEWTPTPEDKEKYGIETANGHYFIFNATELRLVGFPMEPLNMPPPLQVQLVSSRTRRARSVAQNPSTSGKTFRLPIDIENQILALCW